MMVFLVLTNFQIMSFLKKKHSGLTNQMKNNIWNNKYKNNLRWIWELFKPFLKAPCEKVFHGFSLLLTPIKWKCLNCVRTKWSYNLLLRLCTAFIWKWIRSNTKKTFLKIQNTCLSNYYVCSNKHKPHLQAWSCGCYCDTI